MPSATRSVSFLSKVPTDQWPSRRSRLRPVPTPGLYVADTDTPQTLNTTANLNLLGSNAANTMTGGAGNDTLAGLGGNDRLLGQSGNDYLLGQAGQDQLIGGFGNDRLNGGPGNDALRGAEVRATAGNEIDSLTGGRGSDTFYVGTRGGQLYNDGVSNTAGVNNYAVIQDFKQSEGDRIVLSGTASGYRLDVSPRGTPSGMAIYAITPGDDELIAIIRGETSDLGLSQSSFRFI